jgi:hypothetical protein
VQVISLSLAVCQNVLSCGIVSIYFGQCPYACLILCSSVGAFVCAYLSQLVNMYFGACVIAYVCFSADAFVCVHMFRCVSVCACVYDLCTC